MRRKALFLAALLGSTMMLAACGGGDDSKESTTAPSSTVATDKQTEPETEKPKVIMGEVLEIQNGDNTIYGKIYRPTDDAATHPVIIMGHGYNGTNKDFVADARVYAEHGYIAYAYDFCGGSVASQSTGKTTDMTIFTEKSDVIAIFNFLSTYEGVDTDNIYLFGGSQGGLVTSLATEELGDKVAGLLLYYPALCVADDWRKTYPNMEDIPDTNNFWGMNLGRNFFESIHDFYVMDNIGSYTGDVLIIHGDNDAIVNVSYSEEACTKYANSELIVLKGEGHGFSPNGAVKAREYILDYLDKHTK